VWLIGASLEEKLVFVGTGPSLESSTHLLDRMCCKFSKPHVEQDGVSKWMDLIDF
jgi:hypothetical protein